MYTQRYKTNKRTTPLHFDLQLSKRKGNLELSSVDLFNKLFYLVYYVFYTVRPGTYVGEGEQFERFVDVDNNHRLFFF